MNIKISDNFKKRTTKAIFSIILFVLVYLILILCAIGLTILSVVAAFYIIAAKPMAITIGLGVGLASLGFFVLSFLFKFIFKKHNVDRSHLTEITEEEEPQLFEFINKIVTEVGTHFPKKIYLSTDVNASVFYDSSFWSMFFPVKKNLQIGLGLVNTVTAEEFKAILAHEFGHFSQKSMKVGSYVYNVNQVIYNMLYENQSFDEMIQKWANASGYFSLFAVIAVKIISVIQWILKKIYEVVNLNYLALSREMEFHADEVAANVTGYLPLKESLLRMDLADHSYNAVLSFYDKKIAENFKSKNIYTEQAFIMHFLAKKSKLISKNGLPLVSTQESKKFNKSKLNIKDQWSSHPSNEERIANLERINILKEKPNQNLATTLFNQPEKIQESQTHKLFSYLDNFKNLQELNIENFQQEYESNYTKETFDEIYNGYYDNKIPFEFDVKAVTLIANTPLLDSLFDNSKIDMVYEFIGLENDKNVLTNIQNKIYEVKTFDYDGQKFSANDTLQLIPKIEEETLTLKEKITQNDIAIFSYAYEIAKQKGQGETFVSKYTTFFKFDNEFETKTELYYKLLNATSFMNVVTPIAQIKTNIQALDKLEVNFKKEINLLLENNTLSHELTTEIKDNFEMYLKENWIYFSRDKYIDSEVQFLMKSIQDYGHLISRNYFLIKKELLNFQSDLILSRN